MSNKPQKASLPRKILERALLVLLVLLCVGAFYIAVILAEVPPEEQAAQETPVPQAALAPDQPRQIGSLGDLGQLVANFPAPVLAIQPSEEVAFDGGLTNDLAYEGAFARIVTLSYHTVEGYALSLQSIYPVDAFSLIPGEGYSLSKSMTAAMAGMTAVRMEKEGAIRLHVRGQSAMYVFTMPAMDEEAFAGLTRQALLTMPQP